MSDRRVDELIWGLKALADKFEPGYRTHGPLRVYLNDLEPRKDAPWRVVIESGWNRNYGGRITIEASKTGRSLRIWKDGVEMVAKAGPDSQREENA